MEVLLILAPILLGFITGIITGLIPGLHVNTVAALLVGVSAFLFSIEISAISIAIYIVCTAITHSFYDFVPSLFLGVPADESYALLPGQKMVKEGRGLEALHLSIMGSWRGLFISIMILGILLAIDITFAGSLEKFESSIKPYIFWILLVIALILIMIEKNKMWASIIFLCSGIFGLLVFSSPLVPGGTSAAFSSLFPALTGLFGVSGLVLSLFEETPTLTKQEETVRIQVSNTEINGSATAGASSGMFVGLLPGLGGANAATLMLLIDKFFNKNKDRDKNEMSYILMTSAISTSDTLFGIVALYLIDKSRSGASIAISQIFGGDFSLGNLIWITLAMVIAGFLAKWSLTKYGIVFSKVFSFLHYKSLSMAVIVFIFLLVFFTTGIWGLVILVGASFLGMIPPLVNVRRAQAMGFFLIPVLLFYSGYQRIVSTWLNIEAKVTPAPIINITDLSKQLGLCILSAILVYLVMLFASKKSKGNDKY